MARNALTTFKFDFADKLAELPRKFPKNELKERVGELIIEGIREHVARGVSPVKGFGKFTRYSEEYAKKKGVSRNSVNLELTEEMLNAIEARPTPGGIVIGIFGGEAALKAETHNAGTQSDKIPRRPFIPLGGEEFKSAIVEKVLKEAIDSLNDELEDEFE